MKAIRFTQRGPVIRLTSSTGDTTRPPTAGARASIRLSKLGLRGLPGREGTEGPPGPPGDPATHEDPGDLTLIFENHLI